MRRPAREHAPGVVISAACTRRSLIVIALVLAASASPADGQTLGGGRHRITVMLGASGADERDEAVSPLRYRGWGFGSALRYDIETGRSRTVVAASLLSNGLDRVSASGTPSSGEEVGASLGLRHVRLISRASR
jgi:hypothetical protein